MPVRGIPAASASPWEFPYSVRAIVPTVETEPPSVSAPAPVDDYRTPDADRPLPVRYMPQLERVARWRAGGLVRALGEASVPGLSRIDWGLMGVRRSSS